MEKINICFTSHQKDAFSETFIRRLILGIEGKITHCYGGIVPKFSNDGVLIYSEKERLFSLILKKLKISTLNPDQYTFYKYLIKKKFDLAFVNYGLSGAELATIFETLKIPMIVHFHGYDVSSNVVLEKYRDSYKKMFQIAKFLICVSDEMLEDLVKLGAPREKLKKIVYSPNPEFLKIKPNYSSNQVLAVGRFIEKKAPYLTLLAFSKSKIVYPELKLKFVGEGPLLSVCKDIVNSLKINDVEFVGVLNSTQIQQEMSNSFCFIQHSKQASNGDKEGTPVAILEALSSGLPIISTKHAGIPDVVINGQNGFIVNEGDVEGMALRLIELLRDRALCEKLGRNGKTFIKNEFSSIEYFKKVNNLITKSIFE